MATTKKKTTAKKPATEPSQIPNKRQRKSSPPDRAKKRLANDALKLVDKAAALLRKGIRSGAETTHKTRLEAKHQAHDSSDQSIVRPRELLDESTSTLHNVINKI